MSTKAEKRFTLRMDEKLFYEIAAAANIHRRSVAKEIEQAVMEYMERYCVEEKPRVTAKTDRTTW